jgi:hypothetical protein
MHGIVGPCLRRTRNITDLFGINAYGIVLDAPFGFHTYSKRGEGRSPQRHYRCMVTFDELADLPLAKIAERDCFLFSWVPNPPIAASALCGARLVCSNFRSLHRSRRSKVIPSTFRIFCGRRHEHLSDQ